MQIWGELVAAFTPYTTSAGLFVGTRPSWIPDELDLQRIMSYITYEEIYWNVPDVLQISLRGSNELPIYVPSAMAIVDAMNRYTAPGFGVSVAGTSTTDVAQMQLMLEAFTRRERFASKFNGSKRYNIIRGDWVWHMTADPAKAEGSRISLTSVDPGMYFPITDDEDVDKILGVHLVEFINTAEGPRIRRLTYRKVPRSDGTNQITVEDGIFATDKWEGPTDRPEKVLLAPTPLPDTITSIPVYHIKNTEEPGNPFGSSNLRGLERLLGGINQTMSDEDLALALEGIGMYATDSSQPIDPVSKELVPWRLGPGRVVHYDGSKWDRIGGVSGLGDSYGAHYNRLWEALKRSGSTPDIALGSVDVSIAASGVALQLQLGPIIAAASEKNQLILDTHNQMFFDWSTMWLPAYEDTTLEGVILTCGVGSAIPVDRVQRFAELNDMLDRGVITRDYYRSECVKLGYVFPTDIGAKADAELAEKTAAADPFAARLTTEAGTGGQPA